MSDAYLLVPENLYICCYWEVVWDPESLQELLKRPRLPENVKKTLDEI